MLISIEGIDGSGKGTQAKALARWLKSQGYDVFLTSEPGSSPPGKLVRKVLREHMDLDPRSMALLFTADRIEHQRQLKKNAHKIIIADRYSLSTYAYQSAQGVSMSMLKAIHRGIMEPDLKIILDVDPQKALRRTKTREKFEKLDFLKMVRQKYLELADENTFIISTSKSRSRTSKEIKRVVRRYLPPTPKKV